MMSRPSLKSLGLALSFVLGLSCGRTTGLAPVEVAPQVERTQSRLNQLVELENSLSSAILVVESLETRFFDAKISYEDPFPKDLFKHTAMACVTQAVWEEVEPESEPAIVADKLGVKCAVPPLPALETALYELPPPEREEALDAIRVVDKLRHNKAEIDQALLRAPRVIQEVLTWVAAARADLRQTENELNRRRPEYTDDDFELSMTRIRAAREEFDRLEELARRVNATLENRTERLERVMRTTYRGISLL